VKHLNDLEAYRIARTPATEENTHGDLLALSLFIAVPLHGTFGPNGVVRRLKPCGCEPIRRSWNTRSWVRPAPNPREAANRLHRARATRLYHSITASRSSSSSIPRSRIARSAPPA